MSEHTMVILSLNLKILQLIGIGLGNRKPWCAVWNAFVIVILSTYVLGLLFSVVKCNGAFVCTLETMLHAMFAAVAVQMYVTFLRSRAKCVKIIKQLTQLIHDYSTRKCSLKGDRDFNKVLTYITAFVVVFVSYYNIVPLVTFKSCVASHIGNSRHFCGLPEPVYLPYEHRHFLAYHITYTAETLASIFVSTTLIYTTALCCGVVSHVNHQLKSLRSNLRRIVQLDKPSRTEMLIHCIRHHVAISQ